MGLIDLILSFIEWLVSDGERKLDEETVQDLVRDAPLEVIRLARQGGEVEAIRAYRKITRSDREEAVAVVRALGASDP